jgi:hypothetical protein
MKLADVRKNAFAMPLNNAAYPPGPYKFHNREFIVIIYRTDPDILRALIRNPSNRLRAGPDCLNRIPRRLSGLLPGSSFAISRAGRDGGMA